jgi:hypothetical protein
MSSATAKTSVPDVAVIRARVDGDAVCASRARQLREPQDIRNARVSRIAEEGNLVQVEAQPRP